jgi:aryl-alcohol dehydrogenase-like predicted oxidoreductase
MAAESTMMNRIALGKLGLQVSAQGFGCMGLTTAYGTKLPDDEIVDLLCKTTTKYGINFWDTANVYCYSKPSNLLRLKSPVACQEEIIGQAITKVGRENVVIATKTGNLLSVFPSIKLTPYGEPSFLRTQCEASLRRLQVESLDLFYLHRIDQNIPIEVSMWTLKQLVEEKKVKYIGLSECSASTIRRAHKVHPLSAIQMEYSLWTRDIETEILPTCKELGIGLVAYSPLGRGFFGGAHKQAFVSTDFRASMNRFASEKNAQMYDAVQEIAKQKGVSTSQLALAWVQAQEYRLGGAGLVAIPGTTKERNLQSNVEAIKIVLSPTEIDALEKAVPWQEIEGARYDGASSSTWSNDRNPPLTKEIAVKYGIPENLVVDA